MQLINNNYYINYIESNINIQQLIWMESNFFESLIYYLNSIGILWQPSYVIKIAVKF